ncbi:fimbrial protein [Bacteroides intestinalis]|uniref:fimbrial protein n=1 Tax=Bacteroides intestinalis TaxID=329854 RepID=UPI00189FE479|nr:fimbrial protein [Bacteroides intestinalis]
MKTSNYLWAVLATATLSLTACGSDENENVIQPKEKTARLELTLVGTPADSRATGELPTTDESQINRLTVAVFTGAEGNPVNALHEFTGDDIKDATGGTGKKITMLCEPGNGQAIYVVANAASKLFAGVTNLTEFQAKLALLSETTKDAGTGDVTDAQKANNLPMLGTATGKDFTAGVELKAEIALSRLVARVSISSIKTAFDAAGQFKDATFKVDAVYLKNANSSVNMKKEGSVPINGGHEGAVVTANKYLYEAVTGHTANGELTTPYYFYTFPNVSKDNPTKLIIKGTFDADGTGTTASAVTRYYPIVINKKQANTTITTGQGTAKGSIAFNTKYVLTAVIKGEGAPDDKTDIDPATLQLTVTVADWVLTINQNVTFE